MPALWTAKWHLSQFLSFGGSLCDSAFNMSLDPLWPHVLLSHLGGRNKRGKKRETIQKEKKNNKPLTDFKPLQQVLLVFLDATGEGGLSFPFVPSYGFQKMGTRSGSQYSVFQPLAQVLHELPGSNQPLSCSQHESFSFIHAPWWPFPSFPPLSPDPSLLITVSLFLISMSLVIFWFFVLLIRFNFW